jgi:hypothetical protein
LKGASQEESFSWDDDEDTDASNIDHPTKAPAADQSTPVVEQAGAMRSNSTLMPKRTKEVAVPAPSGPSSSAASPRESEESYAVLSPPVRSKEPSSEKEESGSEDEESGSEDEDEDEEGDDDDEEEDDDDDEEGEEEEEEDWE